MVRYSAIFCSSRIADEKDEKGWLYFNFNPPPQPHQSILQLNMVYGSTVIL
jgi:hypothetical protein